MHRYTPRLSFIVLLALLVGLGACAKRNKLVSSQTECPQMIKQADELYSARRAQLDKTQSARIANLLEAARIDQELGQHAACLDKASRAMLLVNQGTDTAR